MPFTGSTRKERNPPNWESLRRQVLTRCGHRCEATMKNGTRCRDRATDVDHILNNDDHSLDNLQGLCRWHHTRKTSREGRAGRTYQQTNRAPEQHPGLR